MSLLLKDPDAVLDYLVDWGAEYLDSDDLVESNWSVEPEEADGVVVTETRFDAKSATVVAAAGVPGRIYHLVNRVVLASGRVDSRSVSLRVERR